MERDSLGTYPAALAAVRTSSGHMESADQMEHLLLKGIRVGLLGGVEAAKRIKGIYVLVIYLN